MSEPAPGDGRVGAGKNPLGAITDVAGIRIGHHQRIGGGWLTGTTVVLPPPGTVAAVDVRGGGPATHETDALRPNTLVSGPDAVVLTGGSAFGLAAAHGAARFLEAHGRGFPALGDGDPLHVVPIVPAAAIFDLARGGAFGSRPDAEFGFLAAESAWASGPGNSVPTGTAGAGTGAFCAAGMMKGGLGTASLRSADGRFTVGAVVAANPTGDAFDQQGRLYASAYDDRIPAPSATESEAWAGRFFPAGGPAPSLSGAGAASGTLPAANTTIAVVATNARLDTSRTQRLAESAQAGLARAVRPSHTLVDGDTVFGLSTGAEPLPEDPQELTWAIMTLCALAADALMLAIADAVLSATIPDLGTTPLADRRGGVMSAYRDLCPSVPAALGY